MNISGKLNEWHGKDEKSGSLKMLRTEDWLRLKAQDYTFSISMIQYHNELIGKAKTIKKG